MKIPGSHLEGFITPTNTLRSDPAFVYHATNVERASEIAREGLKTHKPWEFTDQGEWPDGGTEKRIYFSPKAEVVWAFAPEEGPAVILRVRRDSVKIRNEGTGDVFVREKVPSSKIEILTDEGWIKITEAFR